ncbi:LTA synthase family protein [Lapidilactobacillus mulanensis]|uniref:LTA synthase family protein n=1 Tax=Lapidilactobacillus mulanensis TaxID=2485999 RepID=A0ABW4DNA0_9LACO|nr:LTA synthase family protein [Lapidilactobacillus mulanensis]
MKKQQIGRFLQTRLGFFTLLTVLFWIKTVFAYYVDFSLGATDPLQHFLMFLNPIGTIMLLLSIGLYIKRPKISYGVMFTIYLLNTLLLFSNVLYYRQFTDFLTLNTIMSVGKVSASLGKSTISLLQWYDLFLWLDVIVVALLLARHWLKIDPRPLKPKFAFTTTTLAVFIFLFNLTLSEANRPQLLTRTFDRNYIVKYLGLDTFVVYDSMKTAQNNQIRSSADGTDINNVLNYVKEHQVDANPEYYGKAAGKNVIIIHLESFQQFLIDLKIDGQTVTPFLNSLYHDSNTLSFSNFFHEVGQGKTSDAENMLETSTFGLSEGSVFTSLGSDNTFQAAPAILQQTDNYSSAVFHGNVGSFWNRNHVYKNLGYDYFFDSSYYNTSAAAKIGYGLKDKLLFAESAKYLEQLQQPFYTKFITVTNHMPFLLSDDDSDFVTPTTKDKAVNNYFATAHYLDQAVKEFFAYLDKSGLSKNTLVMIYGDHYGLSDKDNESVASLLGKDPADWTAYDNTQLQRVPFMLHMDGLKGGIKKQYGGEIDVLPTLLHLLGVDTTKYAFFGQDLLSTKHEQLVAFRNNNFVTNQYTVLGGKGSKGSVYDNRTGELLTELTPQQIIKLDADQAKVDRALSLSDSLNMKNLLRFYTPSGFTPIDPDNYTYLDQVTKLIDARKDLGKQSTSLYSQNGNKSTTDLYETDAPEMTDPKAEIDTLPESSSSSQPSSSSQSSQKSSTSTNSNSKNSSKTK